MNTYEFVAAIRSMIAHEDNLQNNRFGWMWALEGLLVAGVGFLWDAHALATIVISMFGVASCVSIWYVLRRGTLAIRNLLSMCSARIQAEYDGAPPIGIWGLQAGVRWFLPWNLLPWLMVAVWVALASLRIAVARGVA